MKIYLAGTFAHPRSIATYESLACDRLNQILFSFHYEPNYSHFLRRRKKWEKKMGTAVTKIGDFDFFLDSGAFSAFTKDIDINLDDYIEYIKTNSSILQMYANLDVIGDPDASMKNQLYMESKGVTPVPCFHFGEPFDVLKFLVKTYDTIAIGGVGNKSNREIRRAFFDRIFRDIICDRSGMPRCKVHGFGMTSLDLIRRYPWWSVDSTSWSALSRNGKVYIPPQTSTGGFDFRQTPCMLTVSSKASNGRRANTLSSIERSHYLTYLNLIGLKEGKIERVTVGPNHKREYGETWIQKNEDGSGEMEKATEIGVSSDYVSRNVMNIYFFRQMEKAIPKWPWAFKAVNKPLF